MTADRTPALTMTPGTADPCAIILAKIKTIEDQNPGRGGRRNAAVTFALGVLDELHEEMKSALQATPDISASATMLVEPIGLTLPTAEAAN